MSGPWETRKVSEVANHALGKMLDKTKNKGDLRPYLRNLNVRWFDFDLSDVLEMRFLPEEASRYTAVKGDVLVCEGGYPGRSAIWEKDEPIYFQKALHRVRFHEPERGKWFLYYLLSKDMDGTLKDHFNGAGIQHLTGEALARFPIPLPPIPEQQRIVAILDEAFAGIATAKANAERNLQNAWDAFESHLQSTFSKPGKGWISKPLEDLCAFSSGGTPAKDVDKYWDGGIPWISGRDMKSTRLDDSVLHISQSAIDETSTRIAPAGSLLVLVRGMGLAHGAQIGELIAPCAFNQDIKAIHPKPGLVSRYLLFALRDRINTSKDVLSNAAHGTLKIDSEGLRNLMIPVPSYEHQNEIVEKINSLSKETKNLESIYTRKLAALDELRQSLLHQAFSGQL